MSPSKQTAVEYSYQRLGEVMTNPFEDISKRYRQEAEEKRQNEEREKRRKEQEREREQEKALLKRKQENQAWAENNKDLEIYEPMISRVLTQIGQSLWVKNYRIEKAYNKVIKSAMGELRTSLYVTETYKKESFKEEIYIVAFQRREEDGRFTGRLHVAGGNLSTVNTTNSYPRETRTNTFVSDPLGLGGFYLDDAVSESSYSITTTTYSFTPYAARLVAISEDCIIGAFKEILERRYGY